MKDDFVSPLCYGGCMCGQNGCPSCGSYAGLMEQTAELLQTLRSAMYPNMFGCNLGNGARLRNAVADCVMRVLPDNYQEISDRSGGYRCRISRQRWKLTPRRAMRGIPRP